MQTGLFDWQQRFEELDKGGDPLVKLNTLVDWETFRPTLEILRQKERKSNAGRKPFDVVVMFKILILQSLYNLSDDQTEFQIRDRLSFMRFLGLTLGGRVPDAKTIWLFRDQLTEAGLVRTVFAQFDQFLRAHGFAAQKGQIVDASIVQAPRQRNRREENQPTKDGPVFYARGKTTIQPGLSVFVALGHIRIEPLAHGRQQQQFSRDQQIDRPQEKAAHNGKLSGRPVP